MQIASSVVWSIADLVNLDALDALDALVPLVVRRVSLPTDDPRPDVGVICSIAKFRFKNTTYQKRVCVLCAWCMRPSIRGLVKARECKYIINI